MAEHPAEQPVVCLLYIIRDAFTPLLDGFLSAKGNQQNRNHNQSHEQRGHQVDGNRNGEVVQEIAFLSGACEQQRKENGADAGRSQQHGHKVGRNAAAGGMPAAYSLVQVFQITVDDDDRIVHDHAEHYDQGRQRNRIEWDADQIHDAHRDKRRYGNGGRGYQRGTQREENHHRENDDCHRNKQVAQKRIDTGTDYTGLVANGVDGHVVRQFGGLHLRQQVLHVLTVLHDVVSRQHFQRNDDAAMPVVFDEAVRQVVPALHTRHILYPHYPVVRVTVYDLLGDFLLAPQCGRHMDGHVLPPAAHASADGGDTLRGQGVRQLLAADAVCRQAVVIDDDGNLLLHVSQNADVRYGGQRPQAVADEVARLSQWPVIPAVAFHSDKQRRRVAELVIDDHIRHALRQGGLERVQPVLDLAPHFILVVHVVVQLHHDAANPVLARAGRLGTVHLLEGEQVAFERPYELLFHLFAGGSRIDAHHDACPQGEIGKFRFRHLVQSVNAENEHQPHD